MRYTIFLSAIAVLGTTACEEKKQGEEGADQTTEVMDDTIPMEEITELAAEELEIAEDSPPEIPYQDADIQEEDALGDVELDGDIQQEDPTDDVGPEEEVQVGACTNSSDLAIVNDPQADVRGRATACATQCLLNHDPVGCSTQCIHERTGLSVECAMCFAQMIGCTITNCLMDCGTNPDSQECRDCRERAGCIAAFVSCSGLPPG